MRGARLRGLDAQRGLSWLGLALGLGRVQGKKGHFPQATHCALVEQIAPLIPPMADVTVLGDGEFDGMDLQTALRKLHWTYVCRTVPNIVMTVYGQERHIGALAPTRGELLAGGQPGGRRSSTAR